MGAYSTCTVRVPVPAQYPVRVRLAKWSTRASEAVTSFYKNIYVDDEEFDSFYLYLQLSQRSNKRK
jgi:hypothetical protein